MSLVLLRLKAVENSHIGGSGRSERKGTDEKSRFPTSSLLVVRGLQNCGANMEREIRAESRLARNQFDLKRGWDERGTPG